MGLSTELGLINNQITDDFGTDNDMLVRGGGHGWTATTTLKGVIIGAKGTSKLEAAQNLYDAVAAAASREAHASMTGEGEDGGDFEGMTEAEAAKCVAECMTSRKPYCECRCMGKNHGAAVGMAMVARLGDKTCKCGCGQTTKRLFVPGHDARYHAAQKRAAAAEAAGLGLDAYLDQRKEAKREAARLARKARREAQKVVAAKAAAVAKTI